MQPASRQEFCCYRVLSKFFQCRQRKQVTDKIFATVKRFYKLIINFTHGPTANNNPTFNNVQFRWEITIKIKHIRTLNTLNFKRFACLLAVVFFINSIPNLCRQIKLMEAEFKIYFVLTLHIEINCVYERFIPLTKPQQQQKTKFIFKQNVSVGCFKQHFQCILFVKSYMLEIYRIKVLRGIRRFYLFSWVVMSSTDIPSAPELKLCDEKVCILSTCFCRRQMNICTYENETR